mgnify:CR=1 FL=1
MTPEYVQQLRDELLRRPPSPEEGRALAEYLAVGACRSDWVRPWAHAHPAAQIL